MKIAVTAKGPDLDAFVDPRFGRAGYILVVDTLTLEYEAIDNEENRNAFKGAGIQAAAAICDKEARVLMTGFCGPNAFKALSTAGIRVVNDTDGIVRDVIDDFNAGRCEYADSANTQGHW